MESGHKLRSRAGIPAASPGHRHCHAQSEHSTMSPVLPFDVIALIIDIVGENKDIDLLKELALVSHSLHQICIKHLFANINLHDAVTVPNYHLASSKKGFLKLVKSRPNIVNYIRKLTYRVSARDYRDEDHLLSPILPTISHLNYLKISASNWNWDSPDFPDISVSSPYQSSYH